MKDAEALARLLGHRTRTWRDLQETHNRVVVAHVKGDLATELLRVDFLSDKLARYREALRDVIDAQKKEQSTDARV